ncbi:MFS transporter [Sphingobium naphthae]|uniref:MFS transporter n=1 Tax=Sphingobium sp. DN12 TaxID=3378073 RepID=UPI001D1710D0|nr:MFS transporter [Sphingobium naphthae]
MTAQASPSIATLIDDRPMRPSQWMTVLMCGLVMFLDGFDTQAISYMAPHIAEEWDLPRAMLGPIFSAALVGLMVGYLFFSPLSDRFGHKRMVVWSTAAFAASTLLCLIAGNVTTLVLLRFLTGVGLGAATPSAVALTSEYSPKRWRASFVLAIYCGFSLGFVAAGLAAGWLIPAHGWRSLFWIGAILPLALVPILFLFLPEAITTLTRPGADRDVALAQFRRLDPAFRPEDLPHAPVGETGARPRAPLRIILASNLRFGTLLLWLVFVINLGTFYAMQSWMPTILTDLGYPTGTVVATTTIFTVGGIVAALIVGPLMDRVSPYLALAGLYAAGFVCVGAIGLLLGSGAAALLATSFLAGICVSGGQKSVIALAAVFYDAQVRSTGVGWALGIGRVGGIGGPLIVGTALGAGLSPQGVFYMLAVPMLVMVAAMLMLSANARRVRADASRAAQEAPHG